MNSECVNGQGERDTWLPKVRSDIREKRSQNEHAQKAGSKNCQTQVAPIPVGMTVLARTGYGLSPQPDTQLVEVG